MNSHLQKCFYIKKFYIIDAQMGFACGTQARRPGMKMPLRRWNANIPRVSVSMNREALSVRSG